MEEIMTDLQFKKILEMVKMILEGCVDLGEAREKIQKLINESEK